MTAGARKNLVLISIDSLRYDCVGSCRERPHLRRWGVDDCVETPNLDEFFEDSLYFSRCISAAPYTTASHASMMTGLYPNRHGVRAFYKWALAEGVRTLADELSERGWACAAVQESGAASVLAAGSRVLSGFQQLFEDEREACRWCADRDGPAFLFLHTHDVHIPYCWSAVEDVHEQRWAWEEAVEMIGRRLDGLEGAPEDKTQFRGWVWERAKRRLGSPEAARLLLEWYLTGVRWFDTVRWPRMLAALREAGLYDDSLLAVFSDHGEAVVPDSVGPPLSHGESLLDDAIRVPLALHGPGIEPGRAEGQVSLVDLAPTALDYLGVSDAGVGAAGEMDGRSLLCSDRGRPCFSEVWRSGGAAAGEKRIWMRHLTGDCTPMQVCVRLPGKKLIWQLGEPMLRRFMSSSGRAGASLKSFLKKTLPRPAVEWLRALRSPKRGAAATKETEPEGTVFVCDLEEDPLEQAPRRCRPDLLAEDERELFRMLREYWRRGVTGPQIRLREAEDERVMEHLRGLGYVD